MATDTVIANLVRDLQPVRPLPVPRFRLAQWGLVAIATMAVVTVVIGPRPDLLSRLAALPLPAHLSLLLVVAIASAIAALATSIPGETAQSWRRWAPVSAIAWAIWLGTELLVVATNGDSLWPGTEGIGCVGKAFAFGVTPGIALMIMLTRGLPGDTRVTMMFGGLAASAVGAFGVELTCPLTSPSHLLVWHGAPVLAAALTAWVIGRTLFDKVTIALSRSR